MSEKLEYFCDHLECVDKSSISNFNAEFNLISLFYYTPDIALAARMGLPAVPFVKPQFKKAEIHLCDPHAVEFRKTYSLK